MQASGGLPFARTSPNFPSRMKVLLRVFAYVRRYPWWAAGTLGCAVFSTALVVVFPKVTQLVIDRIRAGEDAGLLRMAWIAAAAFLLKDGFNALRILLNNTFEQKVLFDLRSDLYAHLQRLPLRWYDERATGDIMTRVLEDVNAVERVLIDGIEQGIVSVLQIGIVLAMLLWYSPKLAGLALLPIPLLIGGALAYTLTAHRRYRRQRKASSAMNALLHDNLAGIRQIKTYVREIEEHARFDSVSDELRRATLNVMRTWALYSPAMSFFASLGLVLVLGFGGPAVMRGEMTIGQLTGFLLLAGFLYEPIGRLHSLNQLVQAGRAAGERVFEIIDEPEEPGGTIVEEAPADFRGDVEFRKVGFAYSGEVPVLHEISLHARPGEVVALVGATGAGKSTVVNLLTRFYEFETGEILIDGRELRSIPRSALRQGIGLVTQESFLFNGTVRDNLRLARPAATDADLWAVLEAANARAFVERLSAGLDSIVGERGVKLSVGEKQRISIARALLKDPPILVLDEATASIDNQTERLIQGALERLMVNRTSFVIAHRLSTIRRADQILVMDHGRIVERGRHEELLRLNGVYARLCAQGELLDPAPAAAA
jgi:ABC-type multidrug transport system fused ATPase/permease subunit